MNLHSASVRAGQLLAQAVHEHGAPNTFSPGELARLYGGCSDSAALFGRALLAHPAAACTTLRYYIRRDLYLAYERGGRIRVSDLPLSD